MNFKKIGWSLLMFAAALCFMYYMQQNKGAQQGPGHQPATTTASAPATSSAPAATQTASSPASQPAGAPATTTSAAISSQPATQEAGPAWGQSVNAAPSKYVIGSLGDKDKNPYLFQVEINNRGAALETIKLRDFFSTVNDKRLHDKDPAGYETVRLKDPEKYKGHYSILNPISFDGRTYLPLATRSLSIQPQGEGRQIWPLSDRNWQLESLDSTPQGQTIRLSWTLFRQSDPAKPLKNQPFLKVYKTYSVKPGEYSVGVSLEMENLSGSPVLVGVDQAGPCGLPREDTRTDDRLGAYGKEDPADSKVRVLLKPMSELQKMAPASEGVVEVVGTSDDKTPQLWVGVVNKFFGAMMYLSPPVKERLSAPEDKAQFYFASVHETDQSQTFVSGIDVGLEYRGAGDNPKRKAQSDFMPALELRPGKADTVNFDLYAGPKHRDILQAPASLYANLNYISTIDTGGSCTWCTFSWLMLGMMWLLTWLAKYIAFGNYGVAIILLVLLVRLVLHPLTKKGQVSMMRMQKMGPQMQKLREKYADDKDTLNKEMMRMYKEQGATPILGCLPMVLQMPIWIALWTGLNASVELRHAAFLPIWITDLAAPDALISWHGNLPIIGGFLGHSFNLLPILLTVATYLQMLLNPQSAQPSTSPEAEKQQKIMKYMMPFMMLFIFYNAPSGLTMYIMASTFAGVIEQYVIKKHIEQREAMAAAVETVVDAPGKAARGSRSKKPKGPFWTKRG